MSSCSRARRPPPPPALQRHRVLVRDAQLLQIRHHAEHRDARPRRQHVEPRLQQLEVAAELVDHERGHARALVGLEQRHRPDQRREHARLGRCRRRGSTGASATRATCMFTMSRSFRLISAGLPAPSITTTSCASRSRPSERAMMSLELSPVREVVARVQAADRLAEHDHLRARVPLGLEQHRVHVDRRRDARRLAPAPPAPFRSRRRPGSRTSSAPCSAT